MCVTKQARSQTAGPSPMGVARVSEAARREWVLLRSQRGSEEQRSEKIPRSKEPSRRVITEATHLVNPPSRALYSEVVARSAIGGDAS